MMKSGFIAKHYQTYFEPGFNSRWLKPETLFSKLRKYESEELLTIKHLGQSVEGRSIQSITYGEGPVKVVAWTQMHGNEPTSTMAIVDLLNFLIAEDDYNSIRQNIRKKITLTIIPMLNPDGAERFTRRNALNIDLNRDAASHSMPELKTLTEWVALNNPDWAFNLHDQRNIFTVGDTDKSATISFLAASASVEKTLTPTRMKSMNLISELAKVVEQEVPGHVGKYTDEFYPRALGEYFHQNEVPCILIESGAYKNDPLRNKARKMNFLCLADALIRIAEGTVPSNLEKYYYQIPANSKNMLDLIVRDCRLKFKNSEYMADLGFLIKETPNQKEERLDQVFVLQDIGDLQFYYGFNEKKGGRLNCEEHNIELDKPANMKIQFTNEDTLIMENGNKISG